MGAFGITEHRPRAVARCMHVLKIIMALMCCVVLWFLVARVDGCRKGPKFPMFSAGTEPQLTSRPARSTCI